MLETVLSKLSLRALAALFVAAVLTSPVLAQGAASLSSERDKVGYMLGQDVAHSIGPGLPDLDLATFRQAVEMVLAGSKPELAPEEARQISQTLLANIGARKAGKPPAAIDRAKAGLLAGTNIGRSLTRFRGEFDVPMFMRGLQDGADPARTPALDAAETSRVRSALSARIAAAEAAERKAQGAAASSREQEFLARNKLVKGVFTTPSGLQYMILRQGDGVRPKPGQRVKVHYVGTLLDGKKFDSSYDRGQPAEFGLDQVIKGWSEGVAMMPVGAKYRFWIPAALGYGENGAGTDIPPNATLVFDVELLGVE